MGKRRGLPTSGDFFGVAGGSGEGVGLASGFGLRRSTRSRAEIAKLCVPSLQTDVGCWTRMLTVGSAGRDGLGARVGRGIRTPLGGGRSGGGEVSVSADSLARLGCRSPERSIRMGRMSLSLNRLRSTCTLARGDWSEAIAAPA